MSAEPRPGLPELAAAQHTQTAPLPAPAALPCWNFENAEFDEGQGSLRVDGLPVAVEPRPLRLLAELLHHQGQVLSKEQLLASVWQGRPTVEHVLPSAVNRLRKALGPRASSRIVTMPRQGYRFMGTVQRSPAAAALPQRPVSGAAVPEPRRHLQHASPYEPHRTSMPLARLEPWPAPAAAGPQVPPTAAQSAEEAPKATSPLPSVLRVAPVPPVVAAPAGPPAAWPADSPVPARRAAWLVAAASAVALIALLLAVALATLASRAA